ncbi:hypothetical protein Golob_002538 [Gossypium lobatum]|uniref:Autophagy-related protein 18b n=1 Tax=Gossypium lobatum TaxID=34289 RepID=A0A7J8N5R6_9ROSI|nr:hypothetical protein [Gossypium lobatum]
MLDTIDTVPNLKGLCAFSPSLEGCFLALPASTAKGAVLVYNVMELQLHCEIDAHRSPLAAIALSSNGKYIATASEQGTIIRVHLVSEATKSCKDKHANVTFKWFSVKGEGMGKDWNRKLSQTKTSLYLRFMHLIGFVSEVSLSYSFRRGTCPSTIFSLSFAPSLQLPDILVATSSSGSVHIFSLGFETNQRTKMSGSFLGSILPYSVNDALDPAHHHVLHNAVSAGVRSYAVVRKVDKVADSSSFEIASCRSVLGCVLASEFTFIVVLSKQEPAIPKAKIEQLNTVFEAMNRPRLELLKLHASMYMEYTFTLNSQSEFTWSLEREFNLVAVISGNAETS